MSLTVDRRCFIKLIAQSSAATAFGGCTEPWRGRQPFPNIVVILADDLGYGDLRCNNPDSKIPTPYIDQLAHEGMRFTDAHSGSAVCTPTRYGLLTGRYSWRSRLKKGVLWGWSRPLIESGRMTVASLLRQRQYHTACIGKWHLGLDWVTSDPREISDSNTEYLETVDYSQPIQNGPTSFGFDYFFGIPASLDMIPYLYIENDRAVAAPTEHVEGRTGLELMRGGPVAPGFRHEDVLPTLTEKALAFIERHTASHADRPFFLYFPLTAPHTPVLPKDFVKGKSQAGPYGDFVVQCDWTVGQIMESLQRHGLSENTLFIITSDNGSAMKPMEEYQHYPSYHFRGRKSDVWDGGHRIPFIARWPQVIQAGSTCEQTICLTDFLATAAAIVDEPLPENAGEDSYDILPLLKKGNAAGAIREATVHHSSEGMFAMRQDRWKLIFGRGSGGWSYKGDPSEPPGQLYDLVEDIGETRNLYDERPEVVARLTALMEKYQTQGRSAPRKR